MCGIMGYYCFGSKIPDKNKISVMFRLLESRGRDASGMAFLDQDRNLVVHKDPIGSSDMIKTKEWKSLSLPRIMIFHCRLKTQGSERNNKNNHPLFNKNGLAIVHNGIVYNDKEIFGKKERDAEVDSEAILSLLSVKNKGDRVKRLFERIEGSFAVGVIDRNDPDRLILIKKDNPIELYFDAADDILYFCSERLIMQEALNIKSTLKRGFTVGEGSFHHYEMENNHALIVNKDGVESYKKYSPKKTSWFDSHFSYQSLSDETEIECPWCLEQTSFNYNLLDNMCEQCGQMINEEDIYNVI